jgi:nucleotide-binding universal stress UspA family protein
MPKPVIAALDPDRPDDAPLIAGAALARITGAPLIALAAYLHDPITNAVSAGTVDEDLRDHALRALEARAGATGAGLLVRGGPSAARVLHEAAAELDARLLVLGSTQRGPLGRVAPGSTGARLLHGASCPVAVVPGGVAADWMPERVGAGFVDVEEGRGALRAAAALARAAGGALRVMTAVEPLPAPAVPPYGAGGHEAAMAAARRELDAAIAELGDDVHSSGEVVLAPAAEALVALSDDVDLLVCGSRGYGPLRAVLTGSVSHAVVRAAHCPVMVVPRGAVNALGEPALRDDVQRAARR